MNLKYTDTMITFSEVPDEISLCVNISNCPIHCPECHSKELWNDIGELLTDEKIMSLIDHYDGCTTFVIMGGDGNAKEVNRVANFIRKNSNLLTCWYSGLEILSPEIDLKNFDFIKLGPYIQNLGGLDSPTTNQKFYQIDHINRNKSISFDILNDITYKFYTKNIS